MKTSAILVAVALLAVLANGYVVKKHLVTHNQFTLAGRFCFSTVKDAKRLFFSINHTNRNNKGFHSLLWFFFKNKQT